MLTTLQIIALCILGAGTLVALSFVVAFIVVSVSKPKEQTQDYTPIVARGEEDEIDLDLMLAKLEEASNKKKEEKQPEEPVVEEVKEEPTVEEIVVEEIVVDENIEDVKVEEVQEEVKEEPVVEEPAEEEVQEEPAKEEKVKTIIVKEVVEEKNNLPEFDYRVRLEKIKDSQAKIDKDLDKTTRAILKYERTIRRKERNQKMLDRRALELTNLNLLMYSVTDIKNVDAEKKARQEELTAHIAELKASIQDAENYLETNKEKHENNLKLREYLSFEKKRYADEVKELEALIAAGKYFDDADGNKNN